MKIKDLKNGQEVMVKPKGFKNYYPMNISRTTTGFTISNYSAGKIGGHEFIYKVDTQKQLDDLDIIF